jgi:hypothetical protein
MAASVLWSFKLNICTQKWLPGLDGPARDIFPRFFYRRMAIGQATALFPGATFLHWLRRWNK